MRIMLSTFCFFSPAFLSRSPQVPQSPHSLKVSAKNPCTSTKPVLPTINHVRCVCSSFKSHPRYETPTNRLARFLSAAFKILFSLFLPFASWWCTDVASHALHTKTSKNTQKNPPQDSHTGTSAPRQTRTHAPKRPLRPVLQVPRVSVCQVPFPAAPEQFLGPILVFQFQSHVPW